MVSDLVFLFSKSASSEILYTHFCWPCSPVSSECLGDLSALTIHKPSCYSFLTILQLLHLEGLSSSVPSETNTIFYWIPASIIHQLGLLPCSLGAHMIEKYLLHTCKSCDWDGCLVSLSLLLSLVDHSQYQLFIFHWHSRRY